MSEHTCYRCRMVKPPYEQPCLLNKKVCFQCLKKQRERRQEKKDWEKRNIEQLKERLLMFEEGLKFLDTGEEKLYDIRLKPWIGGLDDEMCICMDCLKEFLRDEIRKVKVGLDNIGN